MLKLGSPGLCLFLVAAIPSSVSLLGWNLWNPQELISVACGSWLACFVFLGNEDQLDMMYTSLEGKLKSAGSSFMKGIGSKCFVFKFACYWGFIGKKKNSGENMLSKLCCGAWNDGSVDKSTSYETNRTWVQVLNMAICACVPSFGGGEAGRSWGLSRQLA